MTPQTYPEPSCPDPIFLNPYSWHAEGCHPVLALIRIAYDCSDHHASILDRTITNDKVF